jgi:hypothetical protein
LNDECAELVNVNKNTSEEYIGGLLMAHAKGQVITKS